MQQANICLIIFVFPQFDIYATTKSGGNLMLSGGILAENLTELMDIYRAGSGELCEVRHLLT